MEWLQGLEPTLVWGLFSRGLGVVFLISFASIAGQIVRGAGKKGGLPIARRLAKIREDFPSWRRFLYFPTLLWLNDSDFALGAIPWTGIAASLYQIYGGPYALVSLLVCYLCYLSLDLATGLIFPWDSLLFEATVLGLFLPPTLPLPALAAAAPAAPALCWAYRWLLFRVMFGFGKQKFIGATNKDLAYLKGFLIAQPLPSPLGWYIQKLPAGLLKLLVLFMFFAEIPAPFFAMIPGPLSVICAAVTTFLMIGIQAMGSFGYFSILTIAACIPLLDNVTPRELRITELFGPGAPWLVNAYVLVHTLASFVPFLFNSWVGQSWHLWSTWYRLPRVLQLPFDFYRFLHPFRWLHPYGVFPPNTSPGVKISLLVEVTWDNREWHELEFNYSPSNEKSPPKFVSPYHPRGDQAVIYETFGLNPTSLISSMLGPWDPYSYGSQPAANTLVQHIVEGNALEFMKDSALLRERKEPPIAARINTVMLEPVSLKDHFAKGVWWKRSYIGPHTPPRGSDPRFWLDFVPEPEMWHYDAIFWRRRSKLKALMDRSVRGGEDPMQLAITDSDLTPADVRLFWDEFVPSIAAEERETFDSLPEVVKRVRTRFSGAELRVINRLLGRFSLLLIAKLEPMYLDRGRKPLIPAKTYFHLWMAVQRVISRGRDAYLAKLENPSAIADELPTLTPQNGLYLLSILRFESMVFEAQKLRLLTAIMPPHDEQLKLAVSHSSEKMSGFEQLAARVSESFSGFFSVMPVVRDSFKGRAFDHGFPELYPSFRQLDSGEVVVRAYARAPEGAQLPARPSSAPAE